MLHLVYFRGQVHCRRQCQLCPEEIRFLLCPLCLCRIGQRAEESTHHVVDWDSLAEAPQRTNQGLPPCGSASET